MTLIDTEKEITALNAPVGATDARPITDLGAWLDGMPCNVRPSLRALGELLLGVTTQIQAETADQFTARCLGVADCGHLIDEERPLNPVSRLTTAVALAQWIEKFADVCEIGPGEYANPPKWTQTEIGEQRYQHPLCLRVYFPAGTLQDDTGCVIRIEARQSYAYSPEVSAFVTPEHQTGAREVLDRLADNANALNPYRGRALRATYLDGLSLTVIDVPAAINRQNVIVADEVWAEVDLGVTAVRDRHEILKTHGLGARRGVLLCGPPGTGKSAVSAVIAREVVGEFTVIYVEAKAGAELLTVVVEEAQRLDGPVLLVLEDVDLWCRDRSSGASGLSELLQAMDIQPDARILTLASTNDATTLDAAAIRTGRFDAVVQVGYPDRDDAARILEALIAGLPGGEDVDSGAVVAGLAERTSGSDIREIVRRAVLSANGDGISTATLLAEVGSGRYRAEVPGGLYL
jgi:cell division protease FtsH